MESSMKYIFILGVLALVAGVYGGHECGRSSPNMEALKLMPCASAAQDENASVSRNCCLQVQKLGKNPKCLCAIVLSDTAKNSGIKPKVAITIPKRCNLADRPIGYKCGPYTLP